MTKRIFRSICLVAAGVFLASMVLIMGVLYSYFNEVQRSQLRTETNLAAQGVNRLGADYLTDLPYTQCRITWIAADGAVLYDSQSDSLSMENHADREEILEAVENGWGESVRYSSTLTERMLYYAQRLDDGTVVRLSMAQSTVLNLVLGMAQPICLVIALALLLSLVLANRLAKKIVDPLNHMNLDEPLSNADYDELAPLFRRLDSQQSQIQAKTMELRRQQEQFAAVTDNMREGLVLLGSDNKILSINPAAARLLEAPADAVGRDILEITASTRIQQLLPKAHSGVQTEKGWSLGGRQYRLNVSPVECDGMVSGVVLLIFDVTEKAQAEQLRREFTANVSHELKTPLHAISGYAELMAQGVVRQEDTARFAGSIYTEAQRMIRLVGDIIGLSQLDEGGTALQWENTDLYAIGAQTVQSLMGEAQRAQVALTLRGSSVWVHGVSQLLSAVVYNLTDNAIKYNRPGGSVEVHIHREGESAVIAVSDTGIGIPESAQSRVFERFYRVDKSRSKAVGGTGLGLSIVKHAALIHKAALTLESTPGVGTTVTVRMGCIDNP